MDLSKMASSLRVEIIKDEVFDAPRMMGNAIDAMPMGLGLYTFVSDEGTESARGMPILPTSYLLDYDFEEVGGSAFMTGGSISQESSGGEDEARQDILVFNFLPRTIRGESIPSKVQEHRPDGGLGGQKGRNQQKTISYL